MISIKRKDGDRVSKKDNKPLSIFDQDRPEVIKIFLSWVPLFILCGIVIGLLIWQEVMFTNPSTKTDDIGFISWWFSKNILIPTTVVYLISIVSCWNILSLRGYKYIIWMFNQAAKGIFTYWIVFQSLVYFVVSVAYSNALKNDFIVNESTGQSALGGYLILSSMLLVPYVSWLGYKVAWKSYWQLGAVTAQDRYQEKLRKDELKVSGRSWEKFEEGVVKRIFALDGKKPRWGFVWGLIVVPLSIPFLVGVLDYLEAPFVGGLFLYTTSLIFVSIFASCAKINDKKSLKRGGPYLIPVRDQDSDDSIKYSHVGVSRFETYR